MCHNDTARDSKILDRYSRVMGSSDLSAQLAARLRWLRSQRSLSSDRLADRTGVSRSTISLIERGETSPTAAILDRLAGGLGVTLASLFADSSARTRCPVRRADQKTWEDPDSGYVWRNLSAPGFSSPIELVEVVLPAGARVAYDPRPMPPVIAQQIWIVEGAMSLTWGEDTFALENGDCLSMRLDRPIVFRNSKDLPARCGGPRHRSQFRNPPR